MGNKTKLWLGTAISLILIGDIVFAAMMAELGWDFTRLSTAQLETNNHIIREDFNNISITTETADITFLPTNELTASVVCYEQENMRHQVSVKDGTLVVEVFDARKWYEYIGIFLGTPKITLYIPQAELDALTITTATGGVSISGYGVSTCKIKTSTGGIHLKDLSAEEVNLTVSTGKVTLSNVVCQGDIDVSVSTGKANLTDIQCNNLISSGSTGDLGLRNVIATGAFTVDRDTGDVTFDGCDASEISVETDTGDVTGSLKTGKKFLTETDTGKIRVPNSVAGGTCKIQTDTGDIVIQIE